MLKPALIYKEKKKKESCKRKRKAPNKRLHSIVVSTLLKIILIYAYYILFGIVITLKPSKDLRMY